jgi:2-polyprenyl-3-methyl-5-hydroxy-6-metoxy-1,4-benzoquinol methylase
MCLTCRHSAIEVAETLARCGNCETTYPVLQGIVDFRDVKRDLSEGYDYSVDNLYAQKMADVFERVTTANELRRLLVSLRRRRALGTDLANLDAHEVLVADNIQPAACSDADMAHGRSVLEKCDLYLIDAGLPQPPMGVALEDGAGMGYFFGGMAERYREVVVLDLSMAYLLMAVKVAEERGLSNVTFVCASAERLPLLDGSVDFVHNNNVIEHVSHPDRMISEAGRILSPSGLLFIISPNRFSIYFEPHYRLPGYGFFPPGLRRIIIRRWQNRSSNAVALQSLSELRALLKSNFDGQTWLAFIPRNLKNTVSGGGIRAALTRLLTSPVTGAAANFAINKLALPIMPYHVVLGTRSERRFQSEH